MMMTTIAIAYDKSTTTTTTKKLCYNKKKPVWIHRITFTSISHRYTFIQFGFVYFSIETICMHFIFVFVLGVANWFRIHNFTTQEKKYNQLKQIKSTGFDVDVVVAVVAVVAVSSSTHYIERILMFSKRVCKFSILLLSFYKWLFWPLLTWFSDNKWQYILKCCDQLECHSTIQHTTKNICVMIAFVRRIRWSWRNRNCFGKRI